MNRWTEVCRRYTRPARIARIDGYDNVDHLVLGVTVIEYHDRKGRRLPKFVQVVGDVSHVAAERAVLRKPDVIASVHPERVADVNDSMARQIKALKERGAPA